MPGTKAVRGAAELGVLVENVGVTVGISRISHILFLKDRIFGLLTAILDFCSQSLIVGQRRQCRPTLLHGGELGVVEHMA